MTHDLETALEESGRLVANALAKAREELAVLNERRAHLEVLIAQAEAMQRAEGALPGPPPRLTLHEAIELVLTEQGNRWMTVRELADAVNARSLYLKRDGTQVEANQIHARTKNYEQLFEKDGPRVRLRSGVVKERR